MNSTKTQIQNPLSTEVLPQTMRAATHRVYGPPETIQIEDLPLPQIKDQEVLIRVRAVAVTTADTASLGGKPYIVRLFSGLFKPKNIVLGTELSGEVAAVGKKVTKFKVGDAVIGASGLKFGGHAEYISLPEDGAIAHKSSRMSFPEATALAESGLTALPFLRDTAKIQAGDKVLINGAAGAIGVIAVQLAKHFGAEVTAVCGPANRRFVQSLGADHVINYHEEDFTQNRGAYDIVFDAVGKNSFGRSKKALRPGGVYMTTVPSGSILFYGIWTSLFGKKKAKIAFTGLRKGEAKVKDIEVLQDLYEAGKIRPVIHAQFPLDEIIAAQNLVLPGHKRGVCIVEP